jgi:hypothetical protein
MDVRDIVRKNGQHQPKEVLEILAMVCGLVEPGKFKNKKLKKFKISILMYQEGQRLEKNFEPNPQSHRLLLDAHKALFVNQDIGFVFLMEISSLIKYDY